MGRLFTFGCSYTYYAWPTWADIIAVDRNLDLHNFGIAGLGNVGINQRVLEADCKYNFTPDDQIMIMWTSWCREDMIKGLGYEAAGSIFSKYSIKHLKKHYDYADTIVKNHNAIIYTNSVYNVNWQGSAFDQEWIESGSESGEFLLEQESIFVERLKQMYSKKMPKFNRIGFKEHGGHRSFGCLHDGHPDILDHLNIVQQDICNLRQSTIDMTTQLHNEVKDKLARKGCRNIDDATPVINEIINSKYPEFYRVWKDTTLTRGLV